MIIVDHKLMELEEKGRPLFVGLVGAGYAATGLASQLLGPVPGIRLAGIANRTLVHAEEIMAREGVSSWANPKTGDEIIQAIIAGEPVVTDDPTLLAECPMIDVIVEATGEVEVGARTAIEVIRNGKHLVLINAELDSTLGPILKKYADSAGVVYTQADGDQPAVLMNLIREVELLGVKVVVAGNIKGLMDHYRTPETQKKFAEDHNQRPKHVTNFADGTKISSEMATLANATGFQVARRGMLGLPASSVEEAARLFEHHIPEQGGIVDYILGAEPAFGVFVLAKAERPTLRSYLREYKMGDGPLYTFYRPHHLSPLEAPLSIARAALFGDAALVPKGTMKCEVITVAKTDLNRGDRLDGLGGFCCYGSIENYEQARQKRLLPMGLSEGCILRCDINKDSSITYEDIELPAGRLSDKLRREQDRL